MFAESWSKHVKTLYCFIGVNAMLAMPYSLCEQQKKWVFFFIWEVAEDNPCFLSLRHQFWLDRALKVHKTIAKSFYVS